jgi:amino acid transporter
VKILAEVSSFAALVAFFAVNLVLIVLRYRMPAHQRPFRVPLSVGRLPVLPVLAIISIVALLIHFEWQIYARGRHCARGQRLHVRRASKLSPNAWRYWVSYIGLICVIAAARVDHP